MFDDNLVGRTTLPFSVLAQDQLTKLQRLPTPAKKTASTPKSTARHSFSLFPCEKSPPESAEPLTTHPFSPNVSCPEDPKHGASSCSGCSPDRTTHRSPMYPMAASAHRQAWRNLASATLRNTTTSFPNASSTSSGLLFRRAASSSARLYKPSSLLGSARSSAHRSYSTGPGAPPPPRSSGNGIKFWPFVVVIALGSGGYMLLVNRRKGT